MSSYLVIIDLIVQLVDKSGAREAGLKYKAGKNSSLFLSKDNTDYILAIQIYTKTHF